MNDVIMPVLGEAGPFLALFALAILSVKAHDKLTALLGRLDRRRTW